MLGLEMSDGAKGISLGGGTPFPPQPVVIAPQGNTQDSTCSTLTDYSNGCYGHSDMPGDGVLPCGLGHPGHDHLGPDHLVPEEDQMRHLKDELEAFHHQNHIQGIQQPKQEVEPGMCAACGGKIIDRYYLLAVDRQWHLSCLTCTECKLPLDSEVTCFAKDGNIYCKEDYYRLFGLKRCARCQMVITSNELVMKARDLVYHLNCFTCASCGKVLTTGEQFGMQDTMIYCRLHYEMLLQHGDYSQPNTSMPFSDNTPPSGQGHVTYYNGVGAVQKGRPRKRKSPLPDLDFNAHNLGMCPDGDFGHIGPDGMQLQAPRQKRIRTSFKHHQLRIMKSYFALNHNPDAKDLKQLAQKTGLNKRVLQVWFQNARAKYRRNLLKQDSDKNGIIGCQDGSPSAGEDSKPPRSSGSGMSDLSGVRSPALSDISSSASLSDYNSACALEDSDPSFSTHGPSSVGLESELFGDKCVSRIN